MEWSSATKLQSGNNEEWYFNFPPKPLRYLLISSEGFGIDLRKIAVFGDDNCSTATSVTTSLVTPYLTIAYVLGTTVSIPWPVWNITPADCFIPVNFIFKYDNLELATGIFNVDWVAKTITYTSNTCHCPSVSLSAEFNTLNSVISSAV